MIHLAYEQKYLHLKSQVNDYHYFMAPQAQSITEWLEIHRSSLEMKITKDCSEVYRGKVFGSLVKGGRCNTVIGHFVFEGQDLAKGHV